jgi:hypothetical protein
MSCLRSRLGSRVFKRSHRCRLIDLRWVLVDFGRSGNLRFLGRLEEVTNTSGQTAAKLQALRIFFLLFLFFLL